MFAGFARLLDDWNKKKCAYFRWRYVIPSFFPQSSIIFRPHPFQSHALTIRSRDKENERTKKMLNPNDFRWKKFKQFFFLIFVRLSLSNRRKRSFVCLNRKSIHLFIWSSSVIFHLNESNSNALFVLLTHTQRAQYTVFNEPNKFLSTPMICAVIHTHWKFSIESLPSFFSSSIHGWFVVGVFLLLSLCFSVLFLTLAVDFRVGRFVFGFQSGYY